MGGQLTVRLAPQACPKCARTIDAASLPGPEFDEPIAPVPGDLTVCLYCSALLIYAAEPEAPWRLIDLKDWVTLDAPTRRKLTLMAELTKEFRRMFGAPPM